MKALGLHYFNYKKLGKTEELRGTSVAVLVRMMTIARMVGRGQSNNLQHKRVSSIPDTNKKNAHR